MTLYKFVFDDEKIKLHKFEVNETPTTYITNEVISKIIERNSIGKLICNQMILLTPDKRKFIDAILQKQSEKVEYARTELESEWRKFDRLKTTLQNQDIEYVSCICDVHEGDEELFYKDEYNNAFIDNNGNILVTAEGGEITFSVKYCPVCGKRLQDDGHRITDTVNEMIQKYINDPNTRVFIDHNNQLGYWMYRVCVSGTEFWLESFEAEDEALDYIKKYNLKIENE